MAPTTKAIAGSRYRGGSLIGQLSRVAYLPVIELFIVWSTQAHVIGQAIL